MAINDTGLRSAKFTYWDYLFDVGLKGEMGEFGDYFKTWNWETGFRYARNEGQDLSLGDVSQPGLRDALLDTNPATAFNPFLGIFGRNTNAAISRVYVNLHNTALLSCHWLTPRLMVTCLISLRGRCRLRSAASITVRGGTRKPDSLNTTFQTIGSTDSEGSRVNRDVWSVSTRKCGYLSPARRGTSPASIASRLTLPSASSGSARTLLQC